MSTAATDLKTETTATKSVVLSSATQATATDVELNAQYRPIFEQIKAGAVERENDRILPHEQVKWLTDAGFGALRVAKKVGGGGASLSQLFRLLTELAKADSNVAHLFRGHFAFLEEVLISREPHVQEFWAKEAVKGAVVANASSEQGNKGWWDTRTATAENDGEFLLNGTKYYSTGSNFSDWIAVSSHLPDVDKIAIAVRTDAPGVTVEDDWNGFGQKLTGSGTTRFHDVAVDLDYSVRYLGKRPNFLLSYFQLFLLAVQAGIAQAALNDTVDFVRPRSRVFRNEDRPLPKDDPQVQQIIGRLSGQVYAVETTVADSADRLGKLIDKIAWGTAEDDDYYAVENAVFSAQSIIGDLILRITSDFYEVGGASATFTQRALDRHWRNARTIHSHNPVYLRESTLGARLLGVEEKE